jgi:hypothetical protein
VAGDGLVFRAPSTAHIVWALGDDGTRLVLELCQDIARDKTLAWLESSVAQTRWGSGGKHRKPIRDGLIVAGRRVYRGMSRVIGGASQGDWPEIGEPGAREEDTGSPAPKRLGKF